MSFMNIKGESQWLNDNGIDVGVASDRVGTWG